MANPFPEYEKNTLCRGTHWNILLHSNQSYIGRCIVFLTSRDIEDPLLLTPEEHVELWSDILPRLQKALQKLFQPDRINYAHLANTTNHVHWHIVPRYEKNPVREFAGETFTDERVGTSFIPEPQHKPTQEVLDEIRMELARYLYHNDRPF